MYCILFTFLVSQVLENILQLSGRLSEDLIGILCEHCKDPSLMIRKQMAGSLTELLKNFPDEDVVIK